MFVHKGGAHDPGLQAVLRWLPRVIPNFRELVLADADRGKQSPDTTSPLPAVLHAVRSFAPTHILSWVPLLNEAEVEACLKMGARVSATVNSFVSLSSGIFRDQVRFFNLLSRYHAYFVTHEPHIATLRQHGVNAIAAPFFYDPDIYHPVRPLWRGWPRPEYDVLFLGSVMEPGAENRVELLRALAAHFRVYVVTYQRPDIPGVRWLGVSNSEQHINRLLNRSRVVLGSDYVTPRQIEEFNGRIVNLVEPYSERFTLRVRVATTMGSGACYAVERHAEMVKFAGGADAALLWDDASDAVRQIRAALEDEALRKRVADQGWNHTRRRHTVEVRIAEIMRTLLAKDA